MDEARSVIIDKEQGSGSDKGLHSAPRPRHQLGQLVFLYLCEAAGVVVAETAAARGVRLHTRRVVLAQTLAA